MKHRCIYRQLEFGRFPVHAGDYALCAGVHFESIKFALQCLPAACHAI